MSPDSNRTFNYSGKFERLQVLRTNWFSHLIFSLSIFLFLVGATFVNGAKYDPPPNFPPGLGLKLTTFVNWADDIKIQNVWTAYPRTALDIVDTANWAMTHEYRLRPSGHMHTWSPLTIGRRDVNSSQNFVLNNPPPKIILMKTEKYLNKMKVISSNTGRQNLNGPIKNDNGTGRRSARGGRRAKNFEIPEITGSGSFWAEPGISLFDLTEILEQHNLGFSAHPATGGVTLGGVLAIGGHGAGVPALGEIREEGQTYGTMSNLVISLTAVVYDENLRGYTLKTFHRSEKETAIFLVSLGRIFITNVTMRVGALQYLRCESRVDVKDVELFAHPASPSRLKFSNFLDATGRVEAILFPFTERPWLKTWSIWNNKRHEEEEVEVDQNSTKFFNKVHYTDEPYNYPFSENIPKPLAILMNAVMIARNTPKAVALGNAIITWIAQNLRSPNRNNFWGPSRNSLLYVKENTLRMTANGYAILTSRAQVQRVLYETYGVYKELLNFYQKKNKFPINGPLEIRVSGIDDPADVGIEGAESPALSAILPNKNRPDFDTVVWFDVLTFARTPGVDEFMRELEGFLVSTFDATCDYGRLRVEWSKGWGYSSVRPWADNEFLKYVVPSTFPQWETALETFRRYDPHEIFTDSFLRLLLV